MNTRSLPFAVISGLAVTAPAQTQFEVALLDGSVLAVQRVTSSDGRKLELHLAKGSRSVGLDQVLAVHGVAVAASELPVFELGGGDRLRGVLSGGDSHGEWLELVSPVLGRTRVAVDRLSGILFHPELAQATDLRLPTGVDEALFQRAGIGLDVVAGSLQQFSDSGVRFQRDGDKEPRWFAPSELVGLRIGDAAARATPAPCELLTRTGDRVGVRLSAWQDGHLDLELEGGGKVRLPEADFACLLPLGSAAVFLSALPPFAVVESGYDGDVLYPFRRDSSVVGSALVGGGRAHARGIGVHSKSRLEYVVPEGARQFWTRVAIDASALGLAPRAHVHVEIRRGDDSVFAGDLAAGDGAKDSGRIDVQPGQHLVLLVDFGKGRDLADRVDWLSPVFLPAPAR